MTPDLEALRSVDFNWTRQLTSVWHDPPYHLASVNGAQADDIAAYFQQRTEAEAGPSSALGRVVVGVAGSGKTHLVGELRRRVWGTSGWFVLLDFIGIKDFWSSVALGFLNSLQVKTPDGMTQYRWLVQRLAASLDLMGAKGIVGREERVPPAMVKGLTGNFINKLQVHHTADLNRHHDVVRALILLYSDDFESASVAHAWLQGVELDKADAKSLGIKAVKQEPIEIVRGLSWLMAMTGPTLIAVDQIDAIVSESNVSVFRDAGASTDQRQETQSIVERLAQGLMDLHEVRRRAVTVVACLEATWQVLKKRASLPATDRFYDATLLMPLDEATKARELISHRLRDAYVKCGFQPPYDTWPFAANAFETAVGFSPRQLLKACEKHRLACLQADAVGELTTFVQGPGVGRPGDRIPPPPPTSLDLDQAFDREKKAAAAGHVLTQEAENQLRDLLLATLGRFAQQLELPDDIDVEVRSDPDQKRQSLHARLAFTFHAEGDREQHFCLRIIHHDNAIAFQSRLKAAMTASGVDRALPFRHLFILRQTKPPSGTKTAALVKEFEKAGGAFVALTDEDLRAFLALQKIAGGGHPGLETWLRERKPLFATAFFKTLGLCPPSFLRHAPPPDGKAPEPVTPDPLRQKSGATSPRSIPIGYRVGGGTRDGAEEHIAADQLSRHTAVLAGSGSGKTVLIRRIVEEAALLGIPAVVLDSNNDLARLGDAWPSRPEGWRESDAAKASAYHREVEVVIWTPGRAKGNPLTLALLPDFSALSGDPDESHQAIEMARATLEPLVSTSGKAGVLVQGVLADALRGFVQRGAGGIAEFIDFLAELPDAVSTIGRAAKLADGIANQLRAAMATNPLLRGDAPVLDCRTLFEADTPGLTRISVVNLAGFPSDGGRDGFVNRLNMALFSWIKRHPRDEGRLYVIDEAQNFAPAQRTTACAQSTTSLVSQARKYGLGMIFATQATKGIDNKVVSNCTTHFYGKMNAPATIAATRELLRAKGGDGGDIAKLPAGEFYFATEGSSRPVKVRTPMCLSYHPKSPLTADEVVDKAQRTRSPLPQTRR